MTAVEWLQVHIKNCPTAENLMNNIDGFLMEAKEMEKQQIIEAYCFGCKDITENEEIFPRETSENYYNEKFKTKSYDNK